MEFKEGWLQRQADVARKEIEGWSATKLAVMLREPAASNGKVICR